MILATNHIVKWRKKYPKYVAISTFSLGTLLLPSPPLTGHSMSPRPPPGGASSPTWEITALTGGWVAAANTGCDKR